jgi:exosortase/archaeosortase family protein
LATFFLLQQGWERCRDTSFERLLIDRVTVLPAASAINAIWPEQSVRAQGHSLASAQQRINILNGCEGLEVAFLLMAALVASPLSWRRKTVAMLCGLPVVHVLNQWRIIALWQVQQIRPDLFGLMHGTVLPLVLIACVLIFFLFCFPRVADATERRRDS